MRRVVLIGDSIRIGYEPTVVGALRDWAEVCSPAAENCWNSLRVLQRLAEWLGAEHADVVHLNCGLHDLARDRVSGLPRVGIEEYRQNVRQILQRVLAAKPGGIVWATITPTDEVRHHAVKLFDRFEADVAVYNQIACDVASELGVRINDLYGLVMAHGKDRLLMPDGVHFTNQGCIVLGNAVAQAIRTP